MKIEDFDPQVKSSVLFLEVFPRFQKKASLDSSNFFFDSKQLSTKLQTYAESFEKLLYILLHLKILKEHLEFVEKYNSRIIYSIVSRVEQKEFPFDPYFLLSNPKYKQIAILQALQNEITNFPVSFHNLIMRYVEKWNEYQQTTPQINENPEFISNGLQKLSNLMKVSSLDYFSDTYFNIIEAALIFYQVETDFKVKTNCVLGSLVQTDFLRILIIFESVLMNDCCYVTLFPSVHRKLWFQLRNVLFESIHNSTELVSLLMSLQENVYQISKSHLVNSKFRKIANELVQQQ
jgi:hypothetical protein